MQEESGRIQTTNVFNHQNLWTQRTTHIYRQQSDKDIFLSLVDMMSDCNQPPTVQECEGQHTTPSQMKQRQLNTNNKIITKVNIPQSPKEG